jgi:rare lipoprotein A (peptidoglycan hydrolase)
MVRVGTGPSLSGSCNVGTNGVRGRVLPIDGTLVPDVRHLRVVANAALIVVLASVAVPAPVGSRVPNPFDPLEANLFQQVEIAAAVRGTPMTIDPLDPGDRSAGILDLGSTVFEPATRAEPPQARPRTAQPAPQAKAVPRNPWRFDGNVSWYGPGLYGNGTACGQTLTKGLIGVAHRTLPCGTRLQFRNPKNGRVVNAVVIDRGPFVSGRTWDLSHGLCDALNHCYTGAIQWRYAPR